MTGTSSENLRPKQPGGFGVFLSMVRVIHDNPDRRTRKAGKSCRRSPSASAVAPSAAIQSRRHNVRFSATMLSPSPASSRRREAGLYVHASTHRRGLVQKDLQLKWTPFIDIGSAVDSLIARSAGTLPLVTCASPACVQRHGLPREPADLMQGHTIVRMNSPRSGRDFVFQLHRDEQLFEIHGSHRLSVNDSSAALAAGLAGLGVLTTYAFLVTPHLRSGALVRLFPDWRGDDVAVHVAYPANRHLASKVREFVEWAIELLRASEPA
ncbi:LysR substrate-binding domain-containing protein [Paraburkholderia youngii]|uniref:DNA-binding transcriptional LysR family regulator n=1 Tax=Paraburkholderia youngii TaxID=2782701 RepID=A0A7W8LAM2_9BURK|nr:LysR substrate-binding domain-containing protein [Paraburkholderia youngii]MBB5403128.1 DNA-binding transcriptional LysR family regulator [Paraburkholderia youngii]